MRSLFNLQDCCRFLVAAALSIVTGAPAAAIPATVQAVRIPSENLAAMLPGGFDVETIDPSVMRRIGKAIQLEKAVLDGQWKSSAETHKWQTIMKKNQLSVVVWAVWLTLLSVRIRAAETTQYPSWTSTDGRVIQAKFEVSWISIYPAKRLNRAGKKVSYCAQSSPGVRSWLKGSGNVPFRRLHV